MLRAIAAEKGSDLVLVRQGGSHEVYGLRGIRLIVPRHSEIAEGTARAIVRAAEGA
ncbi:type II toxin-antitoxin system HicA family toxin [Streptomyces globosus]|uniref:type II toxin-antitoxin system HicA family toxin n=1 Tax=Streptomyces globosus TaxID=68209 RepID=UPI00380AE445